jgi:hypothetical protein
MSSKDSRTYNLFLSTGEELLRRYYWWCAAAAIDNLSLEEMRIKKFSCKIEVTMKDRGLMIEVSK